MAKNNTRPDFKNSRRKVALMGLESRHYNPESTERDESSWYEMRDKEIMTLRGRIR